jgi:beta-glucosidase
MVGFDDDFQETVARIRFRGRINATGPIQIGAIGAGKWELRIGDQPTIGYELRVSGSGFGEQILAPPAQTTDIEVAGGEVFEASMTMHRDEGSDDALAGAGLFALIARVAPRDPQDVIAEAARAAADADVAVVVVGLTEEQETEAIDKTTLRLSGAQDAMVSAVAAAARKTVVVVNAATPVIMPWRDEVDAVLWVGLPGQEGGHAVAAALLGDIEPAGRLVTTFPVEDEATPAWSVTPVDGDVEYTEGTFIGYRGHHAGRAPAPAFWFGHGLGYASWDYADARVVDGGASPTVAVSVTNTGSRESREVVQVYFRPAEEDQPIRLVGWKAVTVAPGSSVQVEVVTDARMWRRWNTDRGGWDTLGSGGTLLVARGLGDVRAGVDLPAQ